MAKDWPAVAAAINARLAERAITQKALADASGVSVATLRQIQKAEPAERGRPVLIALSVALGWAPGYLEAVSLGEQLHDDPVADLRDAVQAVRADLDEVRHRLANVEAAQQGDR